MKRFLAMMLIAVLGLAMPSCGSKNAPRSVCLPILMYHHIASVGDDIATVSVNKFHEQMRTLLEMGFHPVSFDEVAAFVSGDSELPEKPVCIVFDDGYESNYYLAFPILSRYGIKAAVSIIVSSMGMREYKNTGASIISHATWSQAREMQASGLVTFVSHTHDMHMNAALESGEVRSHCARLPAESADSFISALMLDHARVSSAMRNELGNAPTVFAYPHGVWDAYAENTLRSLGYRITLTSEAGMNTLIRGDHDSLYLLRRYNITETTDINKLLEAVLRYAA